MSMDNFDTFYMSDEEIAEFKKRRKVGTKAVLKDVLLVALGGVIYVIGDLSSAYLESIGSPELLFTFIKAALLCLAAYLVLKGSWRFSKDMRWLLYGIGDCAKEKHSSNADNEDSVSSLANEDIGESK